MSLGSLISTIIDYILGLGFVLVFVLLCLILAPYISGDIPDKKPHQ